MNNKSNGLFWFSSVNLSRSAVFFLLTHEYCSYWVCITCDFYLDWTSIRRKLRCWGERSPILNFCYMSGNDDPTDYTPHLHLLLSNSSLFFGKVTLWCINASWLLPLQIIPPQCQAWKLGHVGPFYQHSHWLNITKLIDFDHINLVIVQLKVFPNSSGTYYKQNIF